MHAYTHIHTHTRAHKLTPLSGNVVQASSVVAHLLSISVSANQKQEGWSRRRVLTNYFYW